MINEDIYGRYIQVTWIVPFKDHSPNMDFSFKHFMLLREEIIFNLGIYDNNGFMALGFPFISQGLDPISFESRQITTSHTLIRLNNNASCKRPSRRITSFLNVPSTIRLGRGFTTYIMDM